MEVCATAGNAALLGRSWRNKTLHCCQGAIQVSHPTLSRHLSTWLDSGGRNTGVLLIDIDLNLLSFKWEEFWFYLLISSDCSTAGLQKLLVQ